MIKTITIVLIYGILLAATSVRANDDPEHSRPTLKGLKSVRVSIRRASTDDSYGFLNDDDLKTAVEAKLRVARIPVVSSESVLLEGGAFLGVDLAVVHPKEDEAVFAFHLELNIEQPARLVRNPSIVSPLSSTWSTGVTGFVGRDRLRSIRECVNDLTDRFVNAYLAENPK